LILEGTLKDGSLALEENLEVPSKNLTISGP